MSPHTIFDDIVAGTIPSWKVWEDDKYLAFLTPFPSTPGLTVVIPKQNPGSYVFTADPQIVQDLMAAAGKVAILLEKAFDTPRIGLVFEGESVPHLHIKLYPLHGIGTERFHPPTYTRFYPDYPGYIDTVNGPRMSDEQLTDIQQKIQKAAQA